MYYQGIIFSGSAWHCPTPTASNPWFVWGVPQPNSSGCQGDKGEIMRRHKESQYGCTCGIKILYNFIFVSVAMSSQNCWTKKWTLTLNMINFWVPLAPLSHSHLKAWSTLDTHTIQPHHTIHTDMCSVNWTGPQRSALPVGYHEDLSHPNKNEILSWFASFDLQKLDHNHLSCTSGDRADRRAVGEALQIGGLQKRKAAGDRRRFPWNGSGEFIVVDLAMMQKWKK